MSRLLIDPLERLRNRLGEREKAGLRRWLRPRAADDRLVDLAGNDYLGLSRDARVIAAATAAINTWGAGATGSRLVTGSTALHTELDIALATHCDADGAL